MLIFSVTLSICIKAKLNNYLYTASLSKFATQWGGGGGVGGEGD